MNHTTLMNRRTRRHGAAFLMLVVLVLLLVLGATQTLVRSEMTLRRGETARLRVRSMAAAIDAAREALNSSTEAVRFPVDSDSNQYIEVTQTSDQSRLIARWVKGDKTIDEMTHLLDQQSESDE